MIYLDNNATTAVDSRVLEEMLPFLQQFYGNPSSLYRHGRIVQSALATARERVAALVGVEASQVVFTSGGTEANNLVLNNSPSHLGLAVSAIEHPSILEAAEDVRDQEGVYKIPVDQQGKVQLASLSNLSSKHTGLVSVMLANNETGVIQDVEAIAKYCNDANIPVHTDAVQALGKIPVNFNQLGVDFMTISSHKIYGPKGCGALIHRPGIKVSALIHGGDQESGHRAGTENVPAIVGFGMAAEIANSELQHRYQYLLQLRSTLEAALKTIPGIKLFAEHQSRLPNTLQFGLPSCDGEMLLMQLDKHAVAVSSGSACKSGGGKPSHVLLAMQVEPALAKSAIRISLGMQNTREDIDEFVKTLKFII